MARLIIRPVALFLSLAVARTDRSNSDPPTPLASLAASPRLPSDNELGQRRPPPRDDDLLTCLPVMRITFLSRPIFDSFFGLVDIKQGAILVVLFGILNKIAGVYGLLGFLFAGGTLGQLSYYVYSAGSLGVFVWGLKAVSEEQTAKLLTFAHFFVLDHLLSTLYTLLFAVVWWVYTPHDGARVSNSAAQSAMIALAKSRGEIGGDDLSVEERTRIALGMWEGEKVFAVLVLLACWVLKVYFALVLYSFASHLRHNTYRALPLTASTAGGGARPNVSGSAVKIIDNTGGGGLVHGEGEFEWDSEEEDRPASRASGSGGRGRRSGEV